MLFKSVVLLVVQGVFSAPLGGSDLPLRASSTTDLKTGSYESGGVLRGMKERCERLTVNLVYPDSQSRQSAKHKQITGSRYTAINLVCVCLCVCVCDLLPRYLALWFILTISRSSSNVKVIGQSLRSRIKNVDFSAMDSRHEVTIYG